jgi:GNAT superfamily N-acetyltransferase
MTTVTSGFGVANANASAGANGNAGTEFLSMLAPPNGDLGEYDNTRPHAQQPASIPQIFRDAMSVREEVYGDQGVPLDAEFDDDDARSWHWVVYASVASTASLPPKHMRAEGSTTKEEDTRRASASAARLPVGTVRLIPAPHGPNKYLESADKHPDAHPPAGTNTASKKKHPTEPYVKLGRLAVLAPYRKLGLAKLLVNTATDYAAKHPETIYQPPSATTMELANLRGQATHDAATWQGLIMIHAQANLKGYWEKHFGFREELVNENGSVEIGKEPHWVEEGIEHVAMWKRLNIDSGRL